MHTAGLSYGIEAADYLQIDQLQKTGRSSPGDQFVVALCRISTTDISRYCGRCASTVHTEQTDVVFVLMMYITLYCSMLDEIYLVECMTRSVAALQFMFFHLIGSAAFGLTLLVKLICEAQSSICIKSRNNSGCCQR